MAKIAFTDQVYVTVRMCGRFVSMVRLEGLTGGYAQISDMVTRQLKGHRGIASIEIKNSSQGWTAHRALLIRA